jgi:hypothetical protein
LFRLGVLILMIGLVWTAGDALGFRLGAEPPPAHSFPATHKVSEPNAQPVRVHGVTTYFGGHIPIFVQAGGKPQILHLTSFDSAFWHIYLFPGAQVTKIHVSGDAPQRVIIHRSREEADQAPPQILSGTSLIGHPQFHLSPPFKLEGEEGDAYRAMILADTGYRLTDFQALRFFRPNEALSIPADPQADLARIAAHFATEDRKGSADPAVREFRQAREDIATLVDRGDLPSQIPLWDSALRPQELRFWSPIAAGDPETRWPSSRDACGTIQLGTRGDDALYCDAGRRFAAQTLWVLGGEGHDILSDTRQRSQLMDGGKGDDIIIADLGNDILYFGPDWGHDMVDMRCRPGDILNYYGDAHGQDGSREPRHMHSRTLVFGRGVKPSDLVWETESLLVNARTGGRIEFVGGFCAKLVAVERGTVPEPPLPEAERAPPVISMPTPRSDIPNSPAVVPPPLRSPPPGTRSVREATGEGEAGVRVHRGSGSPASY